MWRVNPTTGTDYTVSNGNTVYRFANHAKARTFAYGLNTGKTVAEACRMADMESRTVVRDWNPDADMIRASNAMAEYFRKYPDASKD